MTTTYAGRTSKLAVLAPKASTPTTVQPGAIGSDLRPGLALVANVHTQSCIHTIGQARIGIMLNELKLPTFKGLRRQLAEKADREGWGKAGNSSETNIM
jgi:hypothetical protein